MHGLLAARQISLSSCRSDKDHHEKESDRLQRESARLSQELDKAVKELSRLKEWLEVVKKVEADKLREATDAHTRTK